MEANIIIKNGKCLSMEGDETYEWIAIRDDLIEDVGNGDGFLHYISEDTKIIDAEGKTVLPGFIDNHFHVVITGINQNSVDLINAKSLEEVGILIKDAMANNPDKVLLAHNFQCEQINMDSFPGRAVWDKFCNSMPLVVFGKDYHTIMLNSCAMLFFKVPFALDGVEVDENYIPTGVFKKQAGVILYMNISDSFSDEYCDKAVSSVVKKLHKKGITTVAAMEGGSMGVSPHYNRDAEFIYKYKEKYHLGMELFYQSTNINKIKEMGLTRIGGALYVDGTIGCRTAAISFGYKDSEDNYGVYCINKDFLNKFTLDCYKNNLQLALDAIGDNAVQWVIEAHEYAVEHAGLSPLRHRIEHCELINEEQMERAAKLGLVLSMQPTYEGFWGGQGKMYEQRLGENYLKTNPYREIIDHGLVLCGGSDSDVTEANPLLGIHCAINHPVPFHRINLDEALRMFTINGAFALRLEDRLGSIKKGKQADIIILNGDIYNIKKSDIKDVEVETTIKDGEVVFCKNQDRVVTC